MPARVTRMAAGVLPAVLLGLAAGCTAPHTPTPTHRPVLHSSAPEPTRTRTPPPRLAPLDGILGTGTLVAATGFPEGSVSGSVEFTADAQQRTFAITLTGFHTSRPGDLYVGLSTDPAGPNERCTPDGIAFRLGTTTGQTVQHFAVPGLYEKPSWGDPDFIDDLVLFEWGVPGDCTERMVAYAPLTWTIGDRRPDLHVTDSGPGKHARGTVTLVNGEPASYLVVRGDTLIGIAERFGITRDDLFYLNPARTRGSQNPTVYAGETLNLSKASR